MNRRFNLIKKLLVALLFSGGIIVALFYLSLLANKTLVQTQNVLDAFQEETISDSFHSHSTQLSEGSRLQFASLQQVEVFERKSSGKVFWKRFKLPDIVVQATVPVEYNYYLGLDDRWTFQSTKEIVYVTVPQIRFSRPAPDISELKFEVKEASVIRNEAAVLEELKKSMSELLSARAEGNIALIREVGRKRVENFVRTWLMEKYKDGGQFEVKILFEDEKPYGPEKQLGTP